jgi:pimeloyl-ACP methyl ester carboxylesterase
LKWSFGETEASRIQQPVLSVLGAASVALNPRFADGHNWILEHFPDAGGIVLPGAHHFLQVENPRDLATALVTFFARHPISPEPRYR